MIGRGLFIVTVLSNCVLSLPVTSSQLESEDVKVMKCIVEALADVLSRPHPMPVSQECLVILRTDDRLVTILRHHNFLKELQDIAVHGGQERVQVQRDAAAPDATTQTPQAADGASDRSMLEALRSTSERSFLSQKGKSESGNGGEEKGEDSDDVMEEMPVKKEDDESPRSHVSESVDEWSEGKAEKGEDKEEEEEEEAEAEDKRDHLEENSEEEKKNMSEKEKSAASEDKRDAPRHKPKEQPLGEEDEEEKDKRFLSNKQEEEEEEEGDMKRGGKESAKQWSKRGKDLRLKKKADRKESQQLGSHQEVPHHSKEAVEEEEEKKKRNAQKSPEEKELQMIAGRTPEERKGSEEEGSATRKSEELEIESLAAIESELENVAQKLHELRRG